MARLIHFYLNIKRSMSLVNAERFQNPNWRAYLNGLGRRPMRGRSASVGYKRGVSDHQMCGETLKVKENTLLAEVGRERHREAMDKETSQLQTRHYNGELWTCQHPCDHSAHCTRRQSSRDQERACVVHHPVKKTGRNNDLNNGTIAWYYQAWNTRSWIILTDISDSTLESWV